MPRWEFHARTIVEEPGASESADRLKREFPRFDEAYEALKWILARSCDDLHSRKREIDGVLYYLHRRSGDAIANTPDITILFTFDDDEVNLVDVTAEFDDG